MPILEGLTSDASRTEQDILRGYAALVPDTGIIVEIGTGTGGSALSMHNSSNAIVHTIEPYPNSDILETLRCSGVNTWETFSVDAALQWQEGMVDLLFIDGGHDFRSLITDVIVWLPKLSPSGIVIFDDYEQSNKGGMANLAVKICLDSILETGMLTKVTHRYKFLIASVNRDLKGSDIDTVYQHLMQLDINDGTSRAKCDMLAREVPQYFWWHYSYAVDKIAFRRYIETYNMLQMTRKNIPSISSTSSIYNKIEWLSMAIAFKQVELNILRLALDALVGEV